jgi:hypothetical protein
MFLQSQALKIMISLLTLVILFHVLIIVQFIPYEIVWAGKLKSIDEMYFFESVSILVNIFLIIVLLLKGNYIKNSISHKVLNGILWVFVAIFALNTAGNLMAKTTFEKVVFTPLTLIFSVLLWFILKSKTKTFIVNPTDLSSQGK